MSDFDADLIHEHIDPTNFFISLKNEVTVLKAISSVRRMVWQILGIMIKKFNHRFSLDSEEIKRIILQTLEREFGSKKPDLGNLVGCLKGLSKFIKIVEFNDEESLIIREEALPAAVRRHSRN